MVLLTALDTIVARAAGSMAAVDLATAAIDPAARATIVSNAVSKTINACVAEAVR